MPSLPTSLILVGLVFAWLIVLVPMVSRRREYVPENDEDGVGYRVLEKSERTVASRPVLSRTAVRASAMAAPESGFDSEYGAEYDSEYDEQPGYVEADDDADDADDAEDAEDFAEAEESDGAGEFSEADRDEVEHDSVDPREFGVDYAGARVSSGRDTGPTDDVAPHDTATRAREDEAASDIQDEIRRPRRYGLDDEQYQPVPVRGGRGGYDPQAAQEISSYRFQQRRRVALFLAALTAIGCVLGGVFGLTAGWLVGAGAGVILVLYFAYLRRQVRIEEDIRARRATRLARSQRLRADGYAAAVDGHGYGSQRMARPMVRPAASVPPRYHYTGVPVDFDDSDPAFDDLDYYDPMPYRRVAGM